MLIENSSIDTEIKNIIKQINHKIIRKLHITLKPKITY